MLNSTQIKEKSKVLREALIENPVQFREASEQRKFVWNSFCAVPEAKSMTELELNELKLPKDVIVKPVRENWQVDELDQVLLELLEPTGRSQAFQTEPSAPEVPVGAPMVVILARTAIRCTELIKPVRAFRKHARIASLFAKHKKIEDQVKFLQEWRCQLAIGTPNRMLALLEQGALQLNRTALFILDLQLDTKSVSILDAYETREDLFKLYKNYIRPKLGDGSAFLGLI